MMRGILCSLSGLVLLGGLGCGGGEIELANVSGTVTLDGEPVRGVFIFFQPQGLPPSGAITDGEGHFELEYNVKSKGAPLGKHEVYLETAAEDELVDVSVGIGGEPTKFPKKYGYVFETVEVTSGHNDFKFELTSE